MEKDRQTAIIYTTAVCNLKCSYCYIDKNPALKTIDDILEESFKGDYYINFIKEMFPDPNQLQSLETWGGEPFIAMHRCYALVQQLIDFYPSFNHFFSSTNLTTPTWLDEFDGLVNVFKNNPTRNFSINLQLSIDGPAEFTDKNRGQGVTAKIEENFEKLLDYVTTLPSHIDLVIHPKPTFDMDCITMLDSKEKIVAYYQYLESYLEKVAALHKKNVRMLPNIPNTASPLPHTVEDGKKMAKLCQMTRELEKENLTKHYFKFYKEITLYSSGCQCNESLSYKCTNFTCGTGFSHVGFLPYDRISTCHNGFVDLISDYKKHAMNIKETTLDFRLFVEKTKSRFCLTKKEYALYESQMQHFNTPDTTARLTNVTLGIIALANAGQVDEKYLNYDEALIAARFLRNKTSYCVRDNHSITGSLTLQPFGIYKLLLNGAKEHIENDK